MRKPVTRAPLFLRRIIVPLVLTVVTGAVVVAIRQLGLSPLRDATHDWGDFAIGLAVLLLATRVVNYLSFDVAFRLRRHTEAPSLLREMAAILVFSLGFALLLRSPTSLARRRAPPLPLHCSTRRAGPSRTRSPDYRNHHWRPRRRACGRQIDATHGHGPTVPCELHAVITAASQR